MTAHADSPHSSHRIDRSDSARTVALGALAGLAVLKLIMLAGLFSRTPPYPPDFLSPFLGATLAIAALSGVLLLAGSRLFLAPTLTFAVLSLLSYGPHKLYPGEHPFFFAQSAATYPAIIVGSGLILALIISSLAIRRSDR